MVSLLRILLKTICVLWAAPNSIIGLLIGTIGLLTGGRVQWRRGCIEFYGGATTFFLKKTPVRAVAMTLGHTILGQNTTYLESARDHEHVHVKQYERWGPFFLPAYFWFSFWLWLQKKESYRNNPFEKEAYEKTDPNHECGHEH